VLRLRSLGSGSTGNATVIEACGLRTRRLLIDCGMSLRVLSQRLGQAGLEPGQIDAIFITHEHADHIGCAQRLSSQWRIPVWLSEGTRQASRHSFEPSLLRQAQDQQPIDLGEMQVLPFAVPHDAAQPLQLRCSDGQHDWGVLTDLGHVNESVRQALAGCHGLLLECNHDPELLQQSAYPAFLKRRVAGPLGHLANEQAAQLAGELQRGQLRHIVAAHLSQRNNRPELAQQALRTAVGPETELSIAGAQSGTAWIEIG
jgi:phosphoribosyl 1,2-cyclic phosphodiesterase